MIWRDLAILSQYHYDYSCNTVPVQFFGKLATSLSSWSTTCMKETCVRRLLPHVHFEKVSKRPAMMEISHQSKESVVICHSIYMGVSLNGGTPKTSILIGFSIINHSILGVPLFLETPIYNSWNQGLQSNSDNMSVSSLSRQTLP